MLRPLADVDPGLPTSTGAYTDRVPARRPRLAPTQAHDELVESLAHLREDLELAAAFPAEVEAEAHHAASAVATDPDAAQLDDLRDIDFVTIDPEGSVDLDQALHLERTGTGAVLHYAIADVPAFVIPGGAIDAEARLRGQTLYAADGRIPLHPVVISEDAASLLPDQDRRAFVWRFVLDDRARPVETTLRRAIIRSRARWSYVDAQAAVDAGTAPPSLEALAWFGPLRLEREAERGGASLNVPEARIVADDGGYRLERDAPLAIEDWNAQVSLLTGMAAADIMLKGRVGILRTMPAAEADDVAAFRAQTVALGIPWPADVPYGDYLRGLERDSPAALAILDAAAGLFRGAGYATFDGAPPADPLQAAIGAPYAHATAPLRRLVDRWSLVICEALANGQEVPTWARESLPSLPKIMARSDGVANRLGAATVDRVEAALLSGHEGEVFESVVLGQRGDGARVQLTDPPVTAKVAGLDAAAGATVRLRLETVDIDSGTVVLEHTA
ncbi:Ribonuclease R [Microbacterium trichothecenolyticum]|uniref:Ribonuclease R n=1 Tax=Microbacterium trichothecenolyticum TaxID=69370 RepID=A0A0M2HLQ4_MICTR|nr:Ribonuclease R [Microbacterium trichothecenolyticum]